MHSFDRRTTINERGSSAANLEITAKRDDLLVVALGTAHVCSEPLALVASDFIKRELNPPRHLILDLSSITEFNRDAGVGLLLRLLKIQRDSNRGIACIVKDPILIDRLEGLGIDRTFNVSGTLEAAESALSQNA